MIAGIEDALARDFAGQSVSGTESTRKHRLSPDQACALAQSQARRGNVGEAEKILQKAIRAAPDHARSVHEYGLLKFKLGRGEEALDLLRRAVTLAPGEAMYHTNLGVAFERLDRLYEAEAAYRRALELRPDTPSGHFDLGLALHKQERYAEAEAAFRRALEIKPDYPKALNNLGALLRRSGRDTEAEAACRRALELAPDYLEAYYNLALAHRFQPRDPLIKELNQQLARQPRDGRGRTHLLVAIGKAHDDLRLYDKAFGYYRKANLEIAKRVSFDPAAQREQIEAIRSAFPQPLLCPDRSPGAVIPIFVVGMPRAGKTLVESLLAQHPAVIGTGERREWPQALDRVLGKSGIADSFPARLGSLNPAQICEVGKHYLDELRRFRQLPGGRFHVDTLPGNYRHLGLIFRAFPSVKVIYCQRQPLDQCLSIYFKIFTQGHEYSYDLQDLAAYYLNYQAMMAHWLRLYDKQILTVQYETLVREPLEVGRGLYAHCGLDFAPAALCADFRTDQIGHARHYEGQLAPLRAALRR